MFWEVLTLVNVLNTSVVDYDIDSTEFGKSLINEIFTIDWLG